MLAMTGERPQPFLFNATGQPAMVLENAYKGSACFLCGCGPSLNALPLERLNQRGLLVAALNQVGATIPCRPQFWFSVDAPGRFHERIWADPSIVKFAFRTLETARVRRWSGRTWEYTGHKANEYPNTWFLDHQIGFDPETFLSCNPPTWGGHYMLDTGSNRKTQTVFLIALRMLYWLGIRTIYLLGADWHYAPENTYSFSVRESRGSCGTNNTTMGILGVWLAQLRPHLEAAGLTVYNCTPGSRLEAFDRLDFDLAVSLEVAKLPVVETLEGIYSGA